MLNCLNEFLDFNLLEDKKIKNKLKEVKKYLVSKNYTKEKINDSIVLTINKVSSNICNDSVKYNEDKVFKK